MPSDSRRSTAIPYSPKAFETMSGAIASRSWPPLLAFSAASVFLLSLAFYGSHLFPGLGGEINPGDSAKFQILGHTPIMVHGPGYPLVLLLAAVLRALALPLPEWWVLTFALSAVPAAVANTLAFLIARRVTGSFGIGAAAAILLGSANLMAVQATEAEVYALAVPFVLASVFLLMLFVASERPVFFVAASAVYAISFGNHLMMIMLVPVFAWIAIAWRRILWRPRVIALVLLFILVGASQYLYLAYVAHDPATSYSEYMPLPPEPRALIDYILGTYFSDLYGSGLDSPRTARALVDTLRSAHPWLSAPLIAGGILLFAVGWWRRDEAWRELAVVFGAALAFAPFVLWYGAYDIRAFHLPVLAPLLIGAVAALGWWLKRRPPLLNAAAALLLAAGAVRLWQAAVLLDEREPLFAGLKPAIRAMVEQAPVERPIIAMNYELRMATLYYQLLGEISDAPIYRARWRALGGLGDRPSFAGVVIPTDGYQFIRWVEHRRPDMRCRTRKIDMPDEVRWPAYAFECHGDSSQSPARFLHGDPVNFPLQQRLRTGIRRR